MNDAKTAQQTKLTTTNTYTTIQQPIPGCYPGRFRTPYNYCQSPGLIFTQPSKTHQSFKDECDVNNILKKYSKTGIWPEQTREPQFGDFSEILDYQSAVNAVHTARESFGTLPSHVRERFLNDPGLFLAFASDPRNVDELVTMGLATKRKEEAPTAVKNEIKTPPADKKAPKRSETPETE